MSRIDVSVGSFSGPILTSTKLIKVKLLQVTIPFLSSCHFISLNVFSIHINSFPNEIQFYKNTSGFLFIR